MKNVKYVWEIKIRKLLVENISDEEFLMKLEYDDRS